MRRSRLKRTDQRSTMFPNQQDIPKPGLIDPVTGTLVTQGVIAATQAIARGGPRRQYKWNKRAAEDANQMNRDNAIWALEQNRRLQQEQRVYDSPEAQMARYKAAGLNPHLIYGSGSSAGGAFPISTGGIAPSRIDAPMASYPDVAGGFLSAGQTLAQTELAQQKVVESQNRSALLEMQVDIAKANPMLNPVVYESLTKSMIAVADAKANEARETWMIREKTTDSSWERYSLGAKKIQAEVDAMMQKLGLNTADLEIKNKILESKEFENAVKEIQARWLQDGEVTPQHVYQGVMLMLQRMIPQR